MIGFFTGGVGDEVQARKAVFTAAEHMFSVDPVEVGKCRAILVQAAGVQQQGVFLAWRAYQAVFVADPGHAYDYRLTIEECRENMRFAISLDPFNALVPLLALSWRAITENVVPRARPRHKGPITKSCRPGL